MADEPQRHRIELACPECGHTQTEPALVISTQCRACRANFQVRDGKGVTRQLSKVRLARPGASDAAPPPKPKAKPAFRPGPAAPPRRSLLMRLIYPAKPPRDVLCFSCGHLFKAIAEAQSSQCPKCSGYVSLLDYDITEPWNRRIETRGDVVVQKTGSLSATVRCHHLTASGPLSGNIECSGDLIIRSSGKITGTIHCRELRIEKRARVEFLQPVTACSASIDGQVRGQISCSGPVTLQKRTSLHGLVRTTTLVTKPGAKHHGTVEIISAPPA